MAQRLRITGGGGYLGQHLVPLAQTRLPSAEILTTVNTVNPWPDGPTTTLNILDDKAVQATVTAFQPTTIIHTVGSNRGSQMTAVIEQGTASIVAAAARIGARLIHLSTDVIFDGQSPPYAEDDPPNPLHAYGRAKANAEQVVASHANHVIVRTSLIYGLTIMDRGTEWMVKALRAGEPVTLFTDQMRNPISAETLSAACLELVEHPYRGILHVAGGQTISRATFGLRMLDYWQIATRDTLSHGTSDPSRWPQNTTLDISRASAELTTPLLGVDQVLGGHRPADH